MIRPMKDRQRWLISVPLIGIFSLGLPALVARRFRWFAGDWAGTILVVALILWLGLVVVHRTSNEIEQGERLAALPHLLLMLGLVAAVLVLG